MGGRIYALIKGCLVHPRRGLLLLLVRNRISVGFEGGIDSEGLN